MRIKSSYNNVRYVLFLDFDVRTLFYSHNELSFIMVQSVESRNVQSSKAEKWFRVCKKFQKKYFSSPRRSVVVSTWNLTSTLISRAYRCLILIQFNDTNVMVEY